MIDLPIKEVKSPERIAMERRVVAALMLLLCVKQFTVAVMKITVQLIEGKFDGEAVFNQLLDAERDMKDEMEKHKARVFDVLYRKWREDHPPTQAAFRAGTIQDRDEWERRMRIRRHERARRERLDRERATGSYGY